MSGKPMWTPGPWAVEDALGGAGIIITKARNDEGSEYLIECPGSGGAMSFTDQICRTNWVNTPEWKANAHLIAAAPEMYEKAERLLERYVLLASSGDCGFWDVDRDDEVVEMRAALAKARGEAS